MQFLHDPEIALHHLITARDELAARGWKQEDLGTTDGPKCALGALNWADRGAVAGGNICDAAEALREVIGSRYISDWNNAEGRTFDEIVAGFNAAIALVEPHVAKPDPRAVHPAGSAQ